MQILTHLQTKILRAAAGEIVPGLPYDVEQRHAEKALRDAGLIGFVMEDDQPTHVATIQGRALLFALTP